MQCKFCGAQHPDYFYKNQCRRCLSFQNRTINLGDSKIKNVSLELPFDLTNYQKEASNKLCSCTRDKPIFLEAVCGAGKTEVCLALLHKNLLEKRRCCWAIPRREIVLELYIRLKDYFQGIDVIPVCKGYTDKLEGDLIILTTHQLYRYPNTFDFMILDEPDAFPFSNNEMLATFAKNALTKQSQILYLSATRDETMQKLIDEDKIYHVKLPIRPSMKFLPVPIWRLSLLMWIQFLMDYKGHLEDKNLVFVPTISMAKKLSIILNEPYVCSSSDDKNKQIERFRNIKSGTLICTTILERGVTFKDCMVFVLFADHPVFSVSSLIQIAGRVQRGLNPQKGKCYFYSRGKSEVIEQCIKNIEEMNHYAQSVLKV
ncbi:MAG TPA: helicase-related protein [Erysipelothrix sp.]